MLQATALVYSSHNRCHHIHRDWIVERALQSHHNKTILHVPMSMKERHQQEYCWGTFRWFYDQYRRWGLEPNVFYWDQSLSREDMDVFQDYLLNAEVVVLGGGNPYLGYQRFRTLGGHFYGNPDWFNGIMWQRASNGKLTAGFSAGASQLGEFLGTDGTPGFGLARNILTSLHHERGREQSILELAQRFVHCLAFGLPNDSGVAVQQGFLPSGNLWQIIEFIVDGSWDDPKDGWHIKTRQGLNIEHFYPDGRHWTFKNGDRIVRVMSMDSSYQEAWIFNYGGIFDYWTQQPSGYHNIDHIFATH